MKTRSEEDEDLVCEAIAGGADKAAKIQEVTGLSMPRYDRTVLRLRKAGRIVSTGGRWSVVTPGELAPGELAPPPDEG
jgi:hypothetical protein